MPEQAVLQQTGSEKKFSFAALARKSILQRYESTALLVILSRRVYSSGELKHILISIYFTVMVCWVQPPFSCRKLSAGTPVN